MPLSSKVMHPSVKVARLDDLQPNTTVKGILPDQAVTVVSVQRFDGHLFRLVSEAHRIQLAHLFDSVLAVHILLVEALPPQITAVYEAMLPRQTLRFLLADDPGAGKTSLAGLFIRDRNPSQREGGGFSVLAGDAGRRSF